MKGDGSVQYPFGLCILAGLICVAASVVSGYGLKTHLLHWDDEDEALDDGTMEAEWNSDFHFEWIIILRVYYQQVTNYIQCRLITSGN